MALRTFITGGTACLSACGNTLDQNIDKLVSGTSGIEHTRDFCDTYLPLGKIHEVEIKEGYTFFETIVIRSIEDALKKCPLDIRSEQVYSIFTTTKGNIHLLPEDREKSSLNYSAKKIRDYFGFAHPPLILSHACISGVSGILHAHRYIQAGRYKHILVFGADILSDFVVSGFLSFKALSDEICKPYDKSRNGLNLGEAAACMILSSEIQGDFEVAGGSITNDANHISGPSRNGEGLYRSVMKTLNGDQPDFICSHGTATLFNDNMESIAFQRAGLSEIPLHSLKAFFGHTLGCAGLLESILAIESAKQGISIRSLGFQYLGVEEEINVLKENSDMPLNNILKTASGFGGCNASVYIKRN